MTSEQKTPLEAAYAAINARAAEGLSGGDPGTVDPSGNKASNPGELAAAGGEGQTEPSRKEWNPEDQQVAKHILERFQAPKGLLDDPSDEVIEWGLTLSRMQDGIHAKTNRLETEISELKAQLAERETSDRKSEAPSKGAALTEAQALLEAAVEEGDSKKIGPALEKLAAALAAKPAATPKPSETVRRATGEVEDLLVESARTKLEAEWPALRNSAIFSEVEDIMSGLKGARYDNLRPTALREAKMRDAATVVLGPASGAASNQTPARSPGNSVPRPNGHAEPKAPAQRSDYDVAREVLAKRGLR